jgi:hypothetical protein
MNKDLHRTKGSMRRGPEQVIPLYPERRGAAVVVSGLKHGMPRNLLEGRAKLSIQPRGQITCPSNFAPLIHGHLYYFS